MKRSPSRHRQRGWWQAVAGIAAGLLSNKMSNDQSEENTAMSYENSRKMRQTAYQDTTEDLRLAGLNPMLAYQNGATATPVSPVANNRPVTENVASSALAIEQARNAQAQRDLLEAQAEKTRAETEAMPSSVANVQQQTANLQATLPKIEQEVKNLKLQARTEEERVLLTRAQKFLAETEEQLRKGQLTNTEAQTRTQNVLTELRKLEIPGAKNAAQWEESLGQYSKEAGAAGAAAKALGAFTNSARKVLGK